jgi:hypothetical protein
LIDFDGKTFRAPDMGGDAPVAAYHQRGDLVWAEFAGGGVRRGSLTGLRHHDSLELAYTMVLADGSVLAGHCRSTPEILPDGRIRLHECWERYGPHAATGRSTLDEVPSSESGAPVSDHGRRVLSLP